MEEGAGIVLVYDDFTDEIFNKLNSRNCNIIGPEIVISSTQTDPVSSRSAAGLTLM